MMKAFVFAAVPALAASVCSAAEFLPKYAPERKPHATLLKHERSYIRSGAAVDFWALIPYYEGMRGGHSASAASAAAALNALRQTVRYSSSDELITEKSLLTKTAASGWARKISGEKPEGVDLTQLAALLRTSFSAYGMSASAKTIAAPDETSATIARIRKLLVENEASDKSQVIAHYMQSAFTGDPEGAVLTYSPVGAFDAANDRVLILETDRKYYEPYWVSLRDFVKGLSALKGGLLWIEAK
jgi:hypothetical protein